MNNNILASTHFRFKAVRSSAVHNFSKDPQSIELSEPKNDSAKWFGESSGGEKSFRVLNYEKHDKLLKAAISEELKNIINTISLPGWISKSEIYKTLSLIKLPEHISTEEMHILLCHLNIIKVRPLDLNFCNIQDTFRKFKQGQVFNENQVRVFALTLTVVNNLELVTDDKVGFMLGVTEYLGGAEKVFNSILRMPFSLACFNMLECYIEYQQFATVLPNDYCSQVQKWIEKELPDDKKSQADIQFVKGYCHLKGILYSKDKDQAFSYLTAAIEKNSSHDEALNCLGVYYELVASEKTQAEGKSFLKQAQENYVSAATLGNVNAHVNLNMLKYTQTKNHQEKKNIRAELDKAGRLRNTTALIALGKMHEDDMDDKKAQAYYTFAAQNGCLEAFHLLASVCWKQFTNNKVNIKEDHLLSMAKDTFRAYQNSVLVGNLQDKWRLGYLYANGIGTDKNWDIACKHFNGVFENEQGNVLWQIDYMEKLIYSAIKEKQYEIVITNCKFILKDFERLHATIDLVKITGFARNTLALCYENGFGVGKDINKAKAQYHATRLSYYKSSLDDGDSKEIRHARRRLQSLESKRTIK